MQKKNEKKLKGKKGKQQEEDDYWIIKSDWKEQVEKTDL